MPHPLHRLACRAAAVSLVALALPVSAPAATPASLNPPASINSMGDSITRGMHAGWLVGTQWPSLSWTTGENVDSHRVRLGAIRGGDPQDWNDAENGDRVGHLVEKAPSVIGHNPGYVTILVGGNDACTGTVEEMTSVANFRTRLNNALSMLTSSLPTTRIFVASVPDVYRMWEVAHTSSTARSRWSLYNVCESLTANPQSMAAADVARRNTVRQRARDYNTQIAEVCAAYLRCRFDGNAVANTAFSIDDLSGHDYFHPSEGGQEKLADVTWPTTFDFTDKVAPVTTFSLPATPAGSVDGWYAANTSVTVNATDGAGVRGTEVATGPTDPTAWSRYLEPVAVTAAGVTKVHARSVDVNGNTEGSKSVEVKVDKTAPQISAPAVGDELHGAPLALAITSSDATSSVQALACTVDGSPAALTGVTTPSGGRNGTLTVGGEGTRAVACTATDKAGRTASLTRTVRVDTAAPRVAIAADPATSVGGWLTSNPLTVSVSVTDPNLDTASCTLDGEPLALADGDGDDGGPADGDVTGTATIGADGTYDVACSAADGAGNSTSESRRLQVDATAPAVTLEQAPGDDGWFSSAPASATVTATDPRLDALTCTLDGAPVTLTASPVAEGLTATVPMSDDGAREVACTALDSAGHSTTRTTTLRLDTAAPAVTLAASPDGSGGWFTGPGAATVAATDPNAASIACTVDGEDVDVEESPAGGGLTGTVPFSGDGSHDLACTARDEAGNEASDELTVKVDGADPALDLDQEPDGDGGWFATGPATADVTATDGAFAALECTLDGTPVALTTTPVAGGVTAPVAMAADGVRALACTATDEAGNAVSDTTTLKLDTAAPAIALTQAPNGTNGWFTSAASVGVTASDANPTTTSCAVDGDAAPVASGTVAVAGDGTHAVACTARDAAGHTASDSETVKIDTTDPEVALTGDPDGADGWFRTPGARIGVDVAETNPGTVACTPLPLVDDELVLEDDGRYDLSCTATDAAGNHATATRAVKADFGAPSAPGVAADRAPETADGWYRDRVDVTFTAGEAADGDLADGTAGSGIDVASPTPQAVRTTSGTYVVEGSVADLAGNRSALRSLTVKVDAGQPAVGLVCPVGPVVTGSAATATASASDAHSGLATDPSGPVALDTASPGTRVASVTAVDRVGHRATAACEYTVVAATSAASSDPPPSPSPAAPAKLQRRTVRYGRTLVLTGRASAGAKVVARDVTGRTVATATARRDGAYRLALRPRRNTRLTLSTGETYAVSVTPTITARLRDGVLTGTVRPGRAGRTVAIQRRTGSRWTTIARAKLGKPKAGASRFRIEPPATGRLRVCVTAPGLTAGTSRTLRVR